MLRVLVLPVCMFFPRFRYLNQLDWTWSANVSSGFIGFPSVGKSTLMSKLTGQHSEGMSGSIYELYPLSIDNPPLVLIRTSHSCRI